MAMNDSRVDWENQLRANREAHEQGFFCTLNYGPGFTKVCNLVEPTRTLMAMIEDPDWVADMFLTDAQLCADMTEEMIARGFHFDAGWIFDDLGYKHKGFFSPAAYRELLWPAHKLICDCCHSHGLAMLLHSCGYVTEFVPLFIEAGFDCLQPLEVKAGNDLLALKRQYGDRLAFMGGIDVRAMADPDPTVIEREIATKVPAAKEGGGYIFHSDHSVPDNVSFAQYQRVMELVGQYGGY
jgi:uroporphyrinogen decarboxylase